MSDAAERLAERLCGAQRQPEFELLLLEVVQASYGAAGRRYMETRLLMAATMEAALLEMEDAEMPRLGNA